MVAGHGAAQLFLQMAYQGRQTFRRVTAILGRGNDEADVLLWALVSAAAKLLLLRFSFVHVLFTPGRLRTQLVVVIERSGEGTSGTNSRRASLASLPTLP